MNPTATTERHVTHAYKDDDAAHKAFVEHMRARRIDCAAKNNRAMTKAEKYYWQRYEYYLGVVERSLSNASGAALIRAHAASTRATLKKTADAELVKMLDEARTTTEKETIQGCMEAVEEGLRIHAHHTGIY